MHSVIRAIAIATFVLFYGFGFFYGLHHNPQDTAIATLAELMVVVGFVWFGIRKGFIKL